MSVSIENTIGNVESASRKLKEISEEWSAGEGVLPRLMKDRELGDKLENIFKKTDEIVSSVSKFNTYVGGKAKYVGPPRNYYNFSIYARVEPSRDKFFKVGFNALSFSDNTNVNYIGKGDGDDGNDTRYTFDVILGFRWFKGVFSTYAGMLDGNAGAGIMFEYPIKIIQLIKL